MGSQLEVDPHSAPLSEEDQKLLEAVRPSLAEGLALQQWWNQTSAPAADEPLPRTISQWLPTGSETSVYQLIRDSKRWPDEPAYGFSTQAQLGSRRQPVWGLALQQLFDRLTITPKYLRELDLDATTSRAVFRRARQRWRSSLRAFVLRDFFRVAGYHAVYVPPVDRSRRPLANYLQVFNLHQPDSVGIARGLLSSQLYYRRRDTGRVGKFRTADYRRIDGRSILATGPFDWIVMRVKSRATCLELSPFGDTRPKLVAPIGDDFLMILDQRFFECQEPEDDTPDKPAIYGLGFAYLSLRSDPLAPPPGCWRFRFLAQRDGQIMVQQLGIWQTPRQISADVLRPILRYFRPEAFGLPSFRLGIHPLRSLVTRALYGPDLLRELLHAVELFSGGFSSRVGLTNKGLEERILTSYAQRAQLASEDISWVWRAIADWSQEAELPRWARTGED